MSIFYSASKNAFYVDPYFNGKLPADAKVISEQLHSEMILGQQNDIKVAPGPGGMPTGIHAEKLPEVISEKSKANRSKAVNSDIYVEALGATFKYDKAGRASVNETISDAIALGAPEEASIDWRLADNSWLSVTIDDLREVVKAGAQRKLLVWSAFRKWDSGSKETPFNYTNIAG